MAEAFDKMKTGVNEADKSDMRVDDILERATRDFKSEVDTDTAISADDVERAGGFGATDDIGSLLPVAMDFTDFEASLRDAWYFEGHQENLSRPGLGWTEPTESDANLLASKR